MNSDVIKANLVSSDSAIQSLLEQRLDSIIPCESLPEKSIGLSTPAKHAIIQMAQTKKRGRPENPKVPKIQKLNKDGTERKEYTMLTDEQEDNLRSMAQIEHTTVEDIIAVFHVSRRNIKNIIDRQGKKIKKGGEVYRILTPDISKFMQNQITQTKKVTGIQLSEKILDIKKVKIHPTSINLHIRKGMIKQGFPQFTLKNLEIHELARNDYEILAKRVDYTLQHRVLKVTGTHLIYIDETGFLLTEMRSRGRAPIGERCIIHRRARRVEHISCISAITYAFGVIQTTFVHGNVDSTIFCVFITSLLQSFQQFGIKKATAVMDNCPIHKTDAVLKLCKEANINIQYTPPYSCELNPIELVFGFFKHRVNVPVDVSSPSAIVPFLDAALRTVTQEEVASCISFVEEFVFPLAERKEQLSKNLAISHIKEKIASLEDISKIGNMMVFIEDFNDDNEIVAVAEEENAQTEQEEIGNIGSDNENSQDKSENSDNDKINKNSDGEIKSLNQKDKKKRKRQTIKKKKKKKKKSGNTKRKKEKREQSSQSESEEEYLQNEQTSGNDEIDQSDLELNAIEDNQSDESENYIDNQKMKFVQNEKQERRKRRRISKNIDVEQQQENYIKDKKEIKIDNEQHLMKKMNKQQTETDRKLLIQEENQEQLNVINDLRYYRATNNHQLDIEFLRLTAISNNRILNEEIDGDGACLFNSIADLTDKDPFELRQSSVDQMKKYPELLEDIKFERNKFLYRRYMRKQNSWGGLREVRALSLYLGRRIFVHDPSKRLEAYDCGEDLDFHSALHIGLVNGNHFLSMRLQ
ncbi:MAG: hypothetical protein EZS28_029018 [Streblomastix strix]|uniref:OTU domain-containing protein n=1 Tax=Streblomastix strix TaxID=222440 RepID=A0A5J4V095_9EUKA|nr:MAG: hypothetical protein EZS28_029018 [Streblomastix strix]